MNISLIFLAGGKGTRFGQTTPKQFLTLRNKPVALHSFELLSKLRGLTEISVVCEKEFYPLFSSHPLIQFAPPGKERHHSVESGLKILSDEESLVLIHDAARPLLVEEDIYTLLEEATMCGAATLAQKAVQTVKEADEDHFVIRTIPRESLWEIHTPQCIKKSLLHKGFEHLHKTNSFVTDDVSLIESLNLPVKLVPSSKPNLKITRNEDYHVAEALLQL